MNFAAKIRKKRENFCIFAEKLSDMKLNNRNRRVLVADSGSTKTDWVLLDENGKRFFRTQGINPVLMPEAEIAAILQCELLTEIPTDAPIDIHFYGAGIRPEFVGKMEQAFQQAFAAGSPFAAIGSASATVPPVGGIEGGFFSDLLGAARALCGHSEGIACILGTGSNSCLFDGEKIVKNTPALGYILGDEGSGSALGKAFLNAIFKGLLPAELRDDFLVESGLSLDEIIRKVYREPMPNRFLASTSLYIGRHIDDDALKTLVIDNFRRFFRHNIVPYDRRDLAVNFVGSIACHYEKLLREAAEQEGFQVGKILATPIDALCEYHKGEA